jgi:hypothetical protein
VQVASPPQRRVIGRRFLPFPHKPNRKTEVIFHDDGVTIVEDEALPYVVEMLRDVGVELVIEGLFAAFDSPDLQSIAEKLTDYLRWEMSQAITFDENSHDD